MLTLSVRQFQLKASEYLKQLPITLTVYGKPVAIVNTLDKSVNVSSLSVNTKSDNLNGGEKEKRREKETDKGYWNDIGNVGQVSRGWCELHFEKGVEYDRAFITWEDENGNPVVEKKWACPKCVEKYENMERGKVFYL